MKLNKVWNSSLGIALLVTVFGTGCSKDSNDPAAAPTAPAKEIKLQANANLGNILVDKNGRTLYFFSNDSKGENTCTGGCEAYWPVFNAENLSSEKLGDGLLLSDFSVVTTGTGKKQTTYKGWPLYYFAPNGGAQEASGAVGGEGVNSVWFVAKPDYTVMIVNTQLVGNDGKNYLGTYTEGNGNTMYFTDGLGRTLYVFAKDSANLNKFTKSDFSNNAVWPIYETDKIVVPSTLDKSLFGSITVFGKKQLTFKSWPLYYFGADGATRGNNKGVSVPTPGVWPVATQNIQIAPKQ
jgi:predicted lipoprotein with Yx(FWY)xxD motif